MVIGLLSFIGVIVTALSGYIVAKMNTSTDRQKFYEDKIAKLLEVQSVEIRDLKNEIEHLTSENKSLTTQVMELRIKLELREVHA